MNTEDRPERLNGLYRGVVVRHLEHGKLKVWIPGVYPEDWQNDPMLLPDAEQLVPVFGGNYCGNGVFSYPNIGTAVVCQFFNGDQNMPIVIGATQGSNRSKCNYNEVANELDPFTGKQPSSVHMVNAGRTKVKLYEGGQVEAQVTGSNGNSRIILDTNGNIFIEADENIQMSAKNIKFIAKNMLMNVAGKSIMQSAADQIYNTATNITEYAANGNVFLKSAENPSGRMI